ncbi:hypothetical protein PoB_002620800 [Plakobranchus ocellatus]|uniref:Uncharacterized protein n=1 Tax=Plakobranchus ocellatus TaxID=259542 RepID=A0AAV3ZZ36_9GAST|nr:hypothetical protein PoB_002620800 [Plakobranchus ocellatus]
MGFRKKDVVQVLVLTIGNVLHFIGQFSDEWVVRSTVVPVVGDYKYSQGLWRSCTMGTCADLISKSGMDKAEGMGEEGALGE